MARSTRKTFNFTRTAVAAAALSGCTVAWAQTPTAQLAPVVVSGSANPSAGISGWGDTPLAETPLQASVFGAEQIRNRGAQRLADLIGLDPAVGDAYNAEGYWDFLTVRGFVLDNRFNFRRDGLPINAETSIALDNKARVEILKGLSGIQAGTSAPGGLVNYVVKRPLDTPLRSAWLEWRQAGSVTGAVDLSQRFGAGQAFGLRLNAAAARLEPKVRAADGERNLFALAGDWRLSPDTLIEAEVERSHRSQPSVPGFSLLGNTVPAPVDPRINLNNQPWSLPVVLDGTSASLRWQQRLAGDWRLTAHLATQRLRSDDRVAFPFGCGAENPDFIPPYRYCSDGTFDLYDFRSDNERRRTDAIDVALQGKLQTGPLQHTVSAGVLRSRVRNRFEPQAFNFAGTGNVDATAVTPEKPELGPGNPPRDERSTELYARDAVRFGERWTGWFGLRHTRLERDYRQSFTTPWLGASYAPAPGQLLYASWGKGVESEVAPNLPSYTNRGQALPALTSRQVEIGFKGSTGKVDWSGAIFDIERPVPADLCTTDATCTRQADGVARHRGVEATAGLRDGAWTLHAGAQWLHARRAGSQTTALNGLRPTNVPEFTLRMQAGYTVAAIPGLALDGVFSHEGDRMVLPDNSTRIPGHSRFDAGARYEHRLGESRMTWRAGIENLFDKRAWRESPYQFSHAYLFPLAPRTLRLSVEVAM